MNKVMLLYPPGRLLQRSEDRAQCNIGESAAGSVHACNDLGYCAAVLLEKGYEVFLRDYQTEGASFADAVSDIRAFRPDLLVLSTTNTSVIDDLAFLDRVAAFHPCVCAVKGAVFFNIAEPLLSRLDLSHVDCLIGCEMEFVIGAVADHYLRGKGEPDAIGGILYKTPKGFVRTPFECGRNDLDSLPFPARQLMNNALYVRPDTGEPMATVQTGLGCPSGCIYCLTPVISGRNVRTRAVENVYKELEECYYKFGIKNFFFKADTFTIDEAYAAALCDRIIASPLCGKIAFTANSRVKPLSEALLRKMKQAGCFTVAVGFESGSDDTLRRVKKGTTAEDNLRAARMIKAAGIPLFGFFMIGFPWEDKKAIGDTERLIHQIDPDFIELHIATPFYGTELYRICGEYGVLTDTAFGADAYNPATTGTKYLTAHELQKLKSAILFRFYLRPRYLVKKLVPNLLHPVVAANYVRYGVKMVLNNIKKK